VQSSFLDDVEEPLVEFEPSDCSETTRITVTGPEQFGCNRGALTLSHSIYPQQYSFCMCKSLAAFSEGAGMFDSRNL
jgi:hypothetical protein